MSVQEIVIDLARYYCEAYKPDELIILEINRGNIEGLIYQKSNKYVDAMASGIGEDAILPALIFMLSSACKSLLEDGGSVTRKTVLEYLSGREESGFVKDLVRSHRDERLVLEIIVRLVSERKNGDESAMRGREVRPPDLDIHISLRPTQEGIALNYILHSMHESVGFFRKEIFGPVFRGDPSTFRAYLTQKIEGFDVGRDATGSQYSNDEAVRRLARAGHRLFRELFSPEMRMAYRHFRNRVRTVQITSEEPWIPWELVKPFDIEADPPIDDDYLCLRFELTRWLAGAKPPANEIRLGRFACLDASQVPDFPALPRGGDECRMVRSWATEHPGVEDHSPVRASYEALEALLEKEKLGLLHFIGHGRFNAKNPEESGILMADQRLFRADDVEGPLAAQLARNRPLIFLNACHAAEQGWSLTKMDGWAEAWIRRGGCGAFLAPRWGLRDDASYLFAKGFYGALRKGKTLGEAARTAREVVREGLPKSPAAPLAFVVYAHPNGYLKLLSDPRS